MNIIPVMFSKNTPKNFYVTSSNEHKILHEIWSPNDWKAFNPYYDVGWRGLPDNNGVTWIQISSIKNIKIKEMSLSSFEFRSNPYDEGFSLVAPKTIKVEIDGIEIYSGDIMLDNFFSVCNVTEGKFLKITVVENLCSDISQGTYIDLILVK